MNNKYLRDGALTLEQKGSSIDLFSGLRRKIVNFNQVQRNIFDSGYRIIKSIVNYLLVFILAIWLVFLGVGLCASIFGANLEQQMYSSRNKTDVNDFIRHACHSKSNDGKNSGLNDKLLPDAAQCLGSEVVAFFR